MVKITLYNIGEYKKKQFLYCFVSFFYACCLCIPNMLKESKEDIYLEYSVSMLRILPLRVQTQMRILPLRVQTQMRILPLRVQTQMCILPLRVQTQMRILQQLATLSVFPHSIYSISKPEYDGFAV